MSKKKYDYPKSKWFKMKDHMDLQLQKENIKEIAGILKEMAKEKDWSDIPKARKEDYKAFFDRTITSEIASDFFVIVINRNIIS